MAGLSAYGFGKGMPEPWVKGSRICLCDRIGAYNPIAEA